MLGDSLELCVEQEEILEDLLQQGVFLQELCVVIEVKPRRAESTYDQCLISNLSSVLYIKNCLFV